MRLCEHLSVRRSYYGSNVESGNESDGDCSSIGSGSASHPSYPVQFRDPLNISSQQPGCPSASSGLVETLPSYTLMQALPPNMLSTVLLIAGPRQSASRGVVRLLSPPSPRLGQQALMLIHQIPQPFPATYVYPIYQ